eukprot:13833-Pleurochrysis_carterae.AAC.1
MGRVFPHKDLDLGRMIVGERAQNKAMGKDFAEERCREEKSDERGEENGQHQTEGWRLREEKKRKRRWS